VISGVTVVTTLVRFFCCARGCGRVGRPAFPAPSIFGEAEQFLQNSGASRREIAETYREDERAKFSAVIAREGGRSSIPETPVMESRSRGVLDRPVKPDDDSSSLEKRNDETIHHRRPRESGMGRTLPGPVGIAPE
jgi:hypothetical protein